MIRLQASGFLFYGNKITYLFTKAFNRGKVSVEIDGHARGVIDLYSKDALWQSQTAFDHLGPGPHAIVIRNAGPSGTAISTSIVWSSNDQWRPLSYEYADSLGKCGLFAIPSGRGANRPPFKNGAPRSSKCATSRCRHARNSPFVRSVPRQTRQLVRIALEIEQLLLTIEGVINVLAPPIRPAHSNDSLCCSRRCARDRYTRATPRHSTSQVPANFARPKHAPAPARPHLERWQQIP